MEYRPEESVLGMPSTDGLSHLRTQRELARQAAPKKPYEKITTFLKVQVFGWIFHYLKSRFGGRVEFETYEGKADDGVYTISDGPIKIALASDWASGTEISDWVARGMEGENPDYTIHLGDIYYAGTEKEIDENMLGGITKWPLGSKGSFALNANHEMYARGKWYYKGLLPKLGLNRNGGQQGQHASYFCLRNEHWVILGLDTGYHSVGLPLLEKIFKPSAKLDDELMKWLRDVVQIQNHENRGIIVLTHHQYFSQFEGHYERAAKQLSELINRPVIWFWGHEHRLALYGLSRTEKGGGLAAYGRCIGHGGLPIEDINSPPSDKRKKHVELVLYDRRKWKQVGSERIWIGFNGFSVLTLDGENLTIEHKDVWEKTQGVYSPRLLVTEKWKTGPGGKLNGIDAVVDEPHPDLVISSSSSGIKKAVGL